MSYDINQVFLIGNLTRDPETRFSANMAICKFSIANNTGKEDKDVSYFNIVTFGKTAEMCQQYLKKGKKVAIVGRLSQSRWEKDGQKQSRVEIIGQNIQFLSAKSENSGYSGGGGGSYNASSQPQKEPVYNSKPDYDNDVLEEDDIPF